MPSILLSERLSNYVNGVTKLTSSFKTVVEAITFLKNTYPRLYRVLFNKDDQVVDFVTFYLNSEPITDRLHETIPLHEKDCLEIVTKVTNS